jgi:hypothetical protein
MLRSEKLATPATAFLGVVPLNVPLAGFVPIATVIEAVDDVTVLPDESRTVTVGGAGIMPPDVALPGCVVKARVLAAPGFTVNAALSPAVKVSPLVRVAVMTTPLSAFV